MTDKLALRARLRAVRDGFAPTAPIGLAAAFVAFLSESLGSASVPELDAVFVAVLAVGPVAMVVGVVRPEVAPNKNPRAR